MNNVDKIIELLKGGTKISQALREVCGNQRIAIPFDDKTFNVSLDKLELSARAYNALKRNGCHTLNDVVKVFSEKGWNSVKNFGKTSATEVFAKIIDVAWDNMNDIQKAEFLSNILDKEVFQ